MSGHDLPQATRIEAAYSWAPFKDDELEQSIPERFEKQALDHADRLAIRSPEQSFTYDRLNRVANRLARTILSIRNSDAEAVALLLDHGADAPAAMLAVLKAGKFYLVLDPTYPADRLAYMLADSGAALVLTDTKNLPLVARLAPGGLPAVNMDELDENLACHNLDIQAPPDALAMLLYTSGSTGNPKGVMHSHRNVLAEVRNLTNAWCVSSQDRWLLYTSLSFANSVRTIYCAFLNGGAIYPYDVKRNGFGALPDWLQANRITILRTLPTTFRNFMASLPPHQVFRDVRVLSIGGEPMYRSDVDAFNEHFAPSCVIAHGLGPTECFMVCLNFIPQGRHIEAGKLDIGWPLPDKAVHLLDEEGREVDAGEVGEICVKSRYVALGYWRDADRTRAAFTPDPDDSAVRTYRTGDLGMRAADGCLTHVGRRDFQVKVRGFRIDLSEIDVAMHAVDGVKDAVAVAREDKAGETRLVAYFVPSTTPAVTAAHIRRSLARVLPEHLMPAAFIGIEAMPLTPNGKTDRSRLPEPSRARPQLESRFTPPSTAMEKALLSIWSEVLAIDEIGIHDDFFELGGDSLGAARVVGRVQRAFNVDLPFTAIYEAPTAAELVNVIQESLPATGHEMHSGLGTRVEAGAVLDN